MTLKIFGGIYKSFVESDGDHEVFQSSLYLNHIQSKLSRGNPPYRSPDRHLTLLISILATFKKEIRVLDWGGGAGESFFKINEIAYKSLEKLFYCIVDNSKIIAIGKAFATIPNKYKNVELTWISLEKWESHPLLPANIDIVQLGSVLQYIEDWRGFLKKLFSIGSDYIVLDDIFAGKIPEFVTLQNFFRYRIPFQFLNIDDLTEYVQKGSGYNIIGMCDFVPMIRGKEVFYDMTNFPEEFRLTRTKTLILQNDGSDKYCQGLENTANRGV